VNIIENGPIEILLIRSSPLAGEDLGEGEYLKKNG
jgi:hypothetical protein